MHSRELLRLLDRLEPNGKSNRNRDLAVPRFIILMQKCVEHRIPDIFIRNAHFTDLYILLLTLDIANLRQMLKQRAKERQKKSDVEIQDISQNSAIRLLKGGGYGRSHPGADC